MTAKKTTNNQPVTLEDEQLDDAQGGLIGLLLPAVQKVREAAATPKTSAGITDGTSNTFTGDGSV